MISWENILTAVILFWPSVITVFSIGFCCIVFAVFLVGSAFLLFTVFFYGVYSLSRDTGILDTLIERYATIKNLVPERIQRNVKQSFPFVTPNDFERNEQALYICHPHGLYGITWFLHFSGEFTEWPLSDRKPKIAVHSIFFRIPILRELFLQNHCIEATHEAIGKALEEGDSVAILLGGVEELLMSEPKSLRLIVKKREGFLRLAQEHKIPLIPLVCPRENDLFPQWDNTILHSMQKYLYSFFKIAIPLPSFQSLLSWTSIGYHPFEKPSITYILKPVYPDLKTKEEIKSEYIQRLEDFSKDYSISLEIIG
jgi:hypothetical protein